MVSCTAQGDKPNDPLPDTSAPTIAVGGDTALYDPAVVEAVAPEPVPVLESAPEESAAQPETPFSVSPGVTDGGNSVTSQEVGSEVTVGEIRESTGIPLIVASDVCTSTHTMGDDFRAKSTETITGSYGAAIPAGSELVFRLEKINRSENVRDPVEIILSPRFVEVGGQQLEIEGTVEGLQVETQRKNVKKRGFLGALAGAVVAGVAAKATGKSDEEAAAAAIGGGAIGAAAGAVTAKAEGCIRTTAPFTLRLTRKIEMKGR